MMSIESDVTVSLEKTEPTVEERIEAAVAPWRARYTTAREEKRAAEQRIINIREALVEMFKSGDIGDLSDRKKLNEFLEEQDLEKVKRTISGTVNVTLTGSFDFEELEVDEDDDEEEKVREWLVDEGHYDEYVWDLDSIDVSADED